MLVGCESCTQWTSPAGEGLTFDGSWEKGAENRPDAFLSIRHLGFIDDDGVEDTNSKAIRGWAPTYENFTFTATPQGTTLTVDQDMIDAFESKPEA